MMSIDELLLVIIRVGLKQCHRPAMTGNINLTTYKNGDDCGMVYCVNHIIDDELSEI